MGKQMSFVYVQSTGHVLAVATLVAAPKAPPTAADLASPSLIVRNFGDPEARFYLTPHWLAVFTGDPVDAALLNPRGYYWDPTAKQIQSLPNGTTKVGVTFPASGGVKVDLPQNAVGKTTVLVAYPGSDPVKSEVAPPGIVDPGRRTTSIPTGPLTSGTYVLVLAAGLPPATAQVTP